MNQTRTPLFLLVFFTFGALAACARAARLDLAASNALLRRHAPVFVFPNADVRGPIISPSKFVHGGDLGGKYARQPLHCDRFDLDLRTKPGYKAELAGPPPFELQPDDRPIHLPPAERERVNREAIQAGEGSFGHVTPLGNSRYSVKYFLLLANNDSRFGPYGSHEGDWLCLDMQVRSDDPAKDSTLEYVIFHYHGKQILVTPSGSINWRDKQWLPDERLSFAHSKDSNRPSAFLEAGTNEPHAFKGTYTVADQMVYPHLGDGPLPPYDTKNAVKNLDDDEDRDCRLVMNYPGQWGERDKDEQPWKEMIGDVTNPHGPPFQAKMWNRSFQGITNTADPLGDFQGIPGVPNR